ncbi:MAG TPA: regulatory protein RecX [Micromonosporaceae bacterium]|nr:regulatory protein RecX [Micromonosporaceae bacterium]
MARRSPDAADTERPRSEQDSRELARQICLRQLSVRPRTRAELAAALRKKGIPDEIANELLDRYDDVGIVDDGAFAQAWVASRHHGRGLAGRALAGELRRKGVAAEQVDTALEQLDAGTEEATARALVARRLRTERQSARRDDAATLRRLVAMLARKGYPPGLAIRLVKEALAADEISAEFATEIDVDALVSAIDPSDDHHGE